jgi:hypothetical protein
MLAIRLFYLIGFAGLFGGVSSQGLVNRMDFKYQYYRDNNGEVVLEPVLTVARKIPKQSAVTLHFL